MYAVDTVLMPEVYARSVTVWNVRTGAYSTGWDRRAVSENTVEVSNQARNAQGSAYAMPLETGWTTKAGTIVESEGVLVPAVYDTIDGMLGAVNEWLKVRANI